MKWIKIALFTLSLVALSIQSNAQLSNLTEVQISQIINAAKLNGMSQDEIAIYAKSKGYSQVDINRILQNFKSSSIGNKIDLNGIALQKQIVKQGIDETMEIKKDTDSLLKLSEEELKIFGYEVFHNNGISFTPNLNMATPKDYVVGPGDELVVQIYGIAQATLNLKVSPEGKVIIPNVGLSHVGGLSIEAVKSLLTLKIGTRYAGVGGANPSSFIMVTLSNIRTIKINIVGEVKKPGSYQLPGFTTSFNALYAAGGPTVKGSFRNIQVFRGGKQIAEVDLYDFLLRGKTDKNIRLEDNDVLLVPQYGKRVEIVGEVRRNLLFEVKEYETVANLIEMASGFTNKAYRNMLTIQRINGSDKSILNIEEKEQVSTKLFDGDYVIVGKSPNIYINRIQVLGAVTREGDYEFKEGIKINDLINQAGGLKVDAFRTRAILYRTEKDLQKTSISIDLNKALENDPVNNLILNKEDLLVVSNIYDIKENYFVTIKGEVNQTGTFPYSKGMTLSDLILQSKGFKEAASGSSIEIVRRVRDNNKILAKIINVDINKDLSINKNEQFTALEPFDQIFVRASMGVRELKKVYVQGEANYTGQYLMDRPNMTVSDLIKRAGGVLPFANLKGAMLIRRTLFFKKEGNENEYLEKLLEIRERYVDSTRSGHIESSKVQLAKIDREIEKLFLLKFKSDKITTDLENLEHLDNKDKGDSARKRELIKTDENNLDDIKTSLQAALFKNLRDVTVNESQYQFVSIDLDKIIDPRSVANYDMQLQEGDILYIPSYNETVAVSGDVLYPVTVKYINGASFKNYINKAGGFNGKALKGRSYVVESNGAVRKTQRFLGFKFYPNVTPGSQIFVPKNNTPKSNLNLDRVLSLVSSLVTTFLLVKNLSN